MGAAKCPGCGELAGDRVEGLKGQNSSEVILLICRGCGNVYTEQREHAPVPVYLFRPVRDRGPGRRDLEKEKQK